MNCDQFHTLLRQPTACFRKIVAAVRHAAACDHCYEVLAHAASYDTSRPGAAERRLLRRLEKALEVKS
jgi:hypothetical protein